MKDNGRRMRSRVTVTISGMTAGAISGTGKATSWRISAFTPGKTAAGTKDSTVTIRSMATGCTLGAIRRSTLAGGITASSMASAFSCKAKAERRNTVYGRTVRKSDGSPLKKFKPSNRGRSKISPKSSFKILS